METQRWMDAFEMELKLLGRSPNTIECYSAFLKKFLVYFQTENSPKHINTEQIKKYLLIVGEDSPCQFKQSLATLRFFYGKIVGQSEKLKGIKYRKWNPRLPEIIDKSVFLPKLVAIRDIRFKAIIALIYSTGLRINEACTIKIADFNKERKLLTVRLGKGGKDRIVPYPESLKTILNEYYKKKNPVNFLFYGENRNNHITPSAVQKKCREYFGTHPHALRHCFAVNFLENSGSIHVLKYLLGHNDIKTTERYLRVTNPMLDIKNALDEIDNYIQSPSNVYKLRRTGT